MVCIYTAFVVNMDKSSQIAVPAIIRDQENGRCNNIHYAPTKSKHVYKSVLAAKLFGFVDGYDVGYAICYAHEEYLGDRPNPIMNVNPRSLYGLCISFCHNSERRLLADLAMAREAYERRDITDIVWISGTTNPADDLTKVEQRSGTLFKIMQPNRFHPEAQSWIQRDSSPIQTMKP